MMEAEQRRISNRNDKNCNLCLFDDIVCVTEIDWLIDLHILSMDVVFDAKPELSFGWIDDDIDDRMDENMWSPDAEVDDCCLLDS